MHEKVYIYAYLYTYITSESTFVNGYFKIIPLFLIMKTMRLKFKTAHALLRMW